MIFRLDPNSVTSSGKDACLFAIHFLALDALESEIRSRWVPAYKNICTFFVNPSIALIALDPVFAIISGLEVNLMAIYAVEVFVVSIPADVAELRDPELLLTVPGLRAVLVGASLG